MTGIVHELVADAALATVAWLVLAVIDLRREQARAAKLAALEAADKAAREAKRQAKRAAKLAAKRPSGPPVLRIVR